MRRGEAIRHCTAGGGGWGNPLERLPEKVLRDVVDEKVSIEKARELYGVVIRPEELLVDEKATVRLRRSMTKVAKRSANQFRQRNNPSFFRGDRWGTRRQFAV